MKILKANPLVFCLIAISSVFVFSLQSEGRDEIPGGMTSQVVTGTVEPSGTIVTAEGKKLRLVGSKADEVRRYIGEKVQVKGVVVHRDDRTDLDVQNYKLMKEPLMEKER